MPINFVLRERRRRIHIVAFRAVSRKPLGKHVPAATDTHARIEILLETVFSTRSVQRGQLKQEVAAGRDSRGEAGSNTSTVALRVVGGDE
jgi:hypothetical protein